MKASQIVDALSHLIAKYGDCDVKMLDDESGKMEGVSMATSFRWKRDSVKEFHLMTESQVCRYY